MRLLGLGKQRRKPSGGRAIIAISLAAAVCSTAVQVSAQNLALIRDVETEALIAEYSAPIFRVAATPVFGDAKAKGQTIKIHLVNDQSFNAFVIDGQNMFINTGAILLSETPNQLIGVIAHETGHIKGGHMSGLRQHIAKMQTAALMLQLLSVGAMVGGAVSGSSEGSEAGVAALYGGQQVLIRSLLSYRRIQESSADSSGVSFLTQTKQSPAGMLKTFQYFADQSIGSASAIDPYIQTHPAPADRISQLREIAHRSPYYDAKDSPELQLRHDLVRAKIAAYTYKTNPQRVMKQYSGGTLPDRYAQAIVKYFTGGYRAAAPAIDALIASSPNNPYFYELKGTFLLESGLAREAIAPFKKAVAILPKSDYIRIELAHALLEASGPGSAGEALHILNTALIAEDQSAVGFRLQARALAELNHRPEADLSSAKASLNDGDLKMAKVLAERAKLGLAPNTAGWIAADDILNIKPEKLHS